VRITDARECSGGRWFPTRILAVRQRPDGEIWRVKEIVVTALDADERPKATDFVLELRRGIELNHADNLRSAFKLSAPERVGLADLEKLQGRCQQRLEQLERDDR